MAKRTNASGASSTVKAKYALGDMVQHKLGHPPGVVIAVHLPKAPPVPCSECGRLDAVCGYATLKEWQKYEGKDARRGVLYDVRVPGSKSGDKLLGTLAYVLEEELTAYVAVRA